MTACREDGRLGMCRVTLPSEPGAKAHPAGCGAEAATHARIVSATYPARGPRWAMMLEQGPPTHALRCMEIWGSSAAVDQGLATPGLEGWLYSRPYRDDPGGGDVHYLSLCGGGITTRMIVADVAGHGSGASELATSLRDLMRRYINHKDQTAMVRALNRSFVELAQFSRFATAIVATYLVNRRKLTLSNAGHPRPFWRRAATGEWGVLSRNALRSANLPWGVDDEAPYDSFTVELEPEDMLLIYTDALTESVSPTGEYLCEDGLLRLARDSGADLGPRAFGTALLDAVGDYRGGQPAADDLTLLVLRHCAGLPRRATLGEKLDVYAKVFGLKRT